VERRNDRAIGGEAVNLSILERNILHGFGEHAQTVFLKALDRGLPEAERLGNEAQFIDDAMNELLALVPLGQIRGAEEGVAVTEKTKADLHAFAMKRHYHMYFR
jgi:hypothetical protein